MARRFYKKWDIVGFSRDELKQAEMMKKYPEIDYRLGDVRDFDAVLKAIRGADVVIHAAAMKRIEMCEKNPCETIATNVKGTENIAIASHYCGIEKAVTIGSDKGVEPINVYGMTKALADKIFISYNYNCVRYGNVIGSRGSVFPRFMEMVAMGKPLLVTDPDMTRFILTVDRAVDLIVKAIESPMQGDIFTEKSSAAKLIDIACAFSENIEIAGQKGIEKQHEMLISSEETRRLRKTKDSNICIIAKKVLRKTHGEPYTSDHARLLSIEEIKRLISLFPCATEYPRTKHLNTKLTNRFSFSNGSKARVRTSL